MKNLWAPWRMDYVTDSRRRKDECIFEAGEEAPFYKDGLVLYRDRRLVVLLNRYPYANGHLLIGPARHVGDLADLEAGEEAALMAMLRRASGILRRRLRPDGLNIGLNLGAAAGAGLVDHLHFHVVPRWRDDHNFISVLAEVRTIPEHLETTFDRLVPDFQELREEKGRL